MQASPLRFVFESTGLKLDITVNSSNRTEVLEVLDIIEQCILKYRRELTPEREADHER